MRRIVAAIAGALLAATLTAPAHADAAPSREGPLLADAVAAFPVAAEKRAGYVRTAFRHWVDADHDRCNTRAEVLIYEATTAPQLDAECHITGGSWYSYYDNTTVDDASKLDVDHLISVPATQI